MATAKPPVRKAPEPANNRLALYAGLFLVVAAAAVFGLRMMNAPAKPENSAAMSEKPTPRGEARPVVGGTARTQKTPVERPGGSGMGEDIDM